MKKIVIMTLCCISMLMIGCKTIESNQNSYVYNAGYTSAIIWVSKEKPSDQLKSNIVDMVDYIIVSAGTTNLGTTCNTVLTPMVHDYIMKNDNFANSNKVLIKLTSTYILTQANSMLTQLNTSNITSNISYNYVKEFSTGFKDGIIFCNDMGVKYVLKNE